MGMKINPSVHEKLDGLRMRNAMEKAVKQTMYELQKASTRKAPYKTGKLRRSHSTEVRLDSNMIEGLLKNSAEYWSYVEFGTSKMKAKPFVGPAFKKVQPNRRIAELFKEYNKR